MGLDLKYVIAILEERVTFWKLYGNKKSAVNTIAELQRVIKMLKNM